MAKLLDPFDGSEAEVPVEAVDGEPPAEARGQETAPPEAGEQAPAGAAPSGEPGIAASGDPEIGASDVEAPEADAADTEVGTSFEQAISNSEAASEQPAPALSELAAYAPRSFAFSPKSAARENVSSQGSGRAPKTSSPTTDSADAGPDEGGFGGLAFGISSLGQFVSGLLSRSDPAESAQGGGESGGGRPVPGAVTVPNLAPLGSEEPTVADPSPIVETTTETVTDTAAAPEPNNAPAATGDAVATSEDTAVTIAVLSNDSDVDGDSLSVSSVTQGANGTVAVNGDGTLTYTPDADYSGSDSFTYTVSDGNGGTDTATVRVTVNAVNDAPTATGDAVATSEDTAVTFAVLSNDSDVDGDSLSVDSVTQGANGTVAVNGDGTLTYTPDADYSGTDSFTYTVSDGNGGTDTATVTVTVNPVNDAPTATGDAVATSEDTAVTIAVLSNDSDVDGDSLSVSSVTQGANGTVAVNGDGTLTYTPDADYSGSDSFTYTVSDGNGGTDTATVRVTVNAVNDAPTATGDAVATSEDTAVTFAVLSNDSDVDGDSLSVDSVTQGANGTVAVNGDGTLTYTPDADYSGTDSFTYTVSDGNGGTDTATVTVTVNPVNDAPTATGDAVATSEDTAVTFAVLPNDSDVDGDSLSVSSVTQGSNGTVAVNGDGTLTYTPDADYSGTDSFTYTISDGNGGTDTATVNVTVDAVNDAPAATGDAVATSEDTAVTFAVLANDSDVDGDALSVISVSGGANGTVIRNGDGTLTYTPDSDFNGTDSFTYMVSDGNGGTDTGTVTVTVNPLNDAPTATADAVATSEDTAVTFAVTGNDSDVEGDSLSVSAVTQGSNGTVAINGDGTLTYTPDADYSGTDSFTYTVSDGNGGTDTATVTVTVNPVNDAPTASGDTVATAEDTAVTFAVLANDSDVDGDALSVISVSGGANGTVIRNGDGTLTYTPDSDFNGTDSFTYMVSDGNGGTDTGTVTVTVNPVNDAPAATDDAASTSEDTAVVISAASLLANDSDADLDTLSIIEFAQGSNGTVVDNEDGTYTYTPESGFTGADSFTYTVSDGKGGTNTATVNVVVNAVVNSAPTAADDAVPTAMKTAVTIAVLDNDTDADADLLSIDSVTQGANGSVAINADGTLTYTPGNGFKGTDSFTYKVSDGNGGTDTATVSVVVGNSTIGTAGDDTLTGGNKAETLFGMEGNDTVSGSGGDDTLYAGAGDDLLAGDAGADALYGETGNDILLWDSIDLAIDGGLGTDTLRVDAGDADLTGFGGTVTGIENIDLATDIGANTLSLSAQDVLDLSDTDSISVSVRPGTL